MFDKKIIDQILVETDKNLKNQADLVLIGGTALVIKYSSPRATIDVDTYSKISKDLLSAWKKAEEKLGFNIPISKSPIAEGPYNMEERFKKYTELKLKNLQVYVPDPADLILMKIPRFFGKDREDIHHLISSCKISEKLLLKRFTDEMGHIVGDPKIIQSHYLLAIEDSFGPDVADIHAKKIQR